jgi:hypothetical protein
LLCSSGFIEPGGRDEFCRDKLLLALIIDGRQREGRFGLRELGTDRRDLVGALSFAQVFKQRLRAPHARSRFLPGSPLVFLLEREQGGVCRNAVATFHTERIKIAGKGRGKTDVFSLGIARENIVGGAVASAQSGREYGGEGETSEHCRFHFLSPEFRTAGGSFAKPSSAMSMR